jgi:large subunit ribosomal protein L31
MKPEIHPKYNQIEITVGSTRTSEMKTEVCSNCHPFFTGKQILLDTAGQVERFQKRLGRSR